MTEPTLDRRQALSLLAAAPAALTGTLSQAATVASEPSHTSKPAGPVTPALAAYIAGNRSASIPEEHRELARQHILDTLASIVACRDLEPSILARRYAVAQSGSVSNAATILGTKEKASLSDAVFASAMAGHGAEINDFIPSAFVQPGPSIVSAAIALAEMRGGSGDMIVRAIVTGYEMSGRVPKAVGVRNLYNSGIANHGIAPVFGTSAAAAVMIGTPQDRISDLLTFSAQQASGSWQWLLDVEHIEKAFVFAGMGARNGLQAALLVEAGFRGVRDSFDNPEGWLRGGLFAKGDSNPGYLIEQLGERSELPLTAFKRYPVGGPTQPAIKGLLELLPRIDRSNVQSVRIEMPGRWQAFRDAAMPALNLRYTTSLILLDGKLDFVAAQSLERMANDSKVKAFMERVTIAHDPAQEAAPGTPRTESARVIVVENGGKKHETYVPYVVGFPSHPMSRQEVEDKAMELMSPRLGSTRARQVVERVRTLEQLKNGGELVRMIAS
jgi:2-methylcitrate dehydratase PrpD